MIRLLFLMLICLLQTAPVQVLATEQAPNYVIAVSEKTLGEPGWKLVAESLAAKHKGTVVPYETLPDAAVELARIMPRFVCFVATPSEANKKFVAEVHQLTRHLDDDPYTDLLWGILTGFNAENVLNIASTAEPLLVHRVAAGTDLPLERFDEGICYSELEAGRIRSRKPGQPPVTEKGPVDTTKLLADSLGEYKADLFVTSGHATERDWQIGFRYRNGSFQSKGGKLFGVDTGGRKHPILSDTPRVYLAVGNCLMGHIDGPDAMALAFLNSAGVRQMVGYTDLTWFGYGGWGVLDYFVEQPGRFTLTQAFHANHLALLHKLETTFPDEAGKASGEGSRNGLLYDRDIVAFYGDPAWEARLQPAACGWEQELTEQNGTYIFTITPKQGDKSFELMSSNGSQRGGRPVVEFLPARVKNVTIIEGKELAAVVTDNFVLVPLPKAPLANQYRIVFSAARAE